MIQFVKLYSWKFSLIHWKKKYTANNVHNWNMSFWHELGLYLSRTSFLVPVYSELHYRHKDRWYQQRWELVSLCIYLSLSSCEPPIQRQMIPAKMELLEELTLSRCELTLLRQVLPSNMRLISIYIYVTMNGGCKASWYLQRRGLVYLYTSFLLWTVVKRQYLPSNTGEKLLYLFPLLLIFRSPFPSNFLFSLFLLSLCLD